MSQAAGYRDDDGPQESGHPSPRLRAVRTPAPRPVHDPRVVPLRQQRTTPAPEAGPRVGVLALQGGVREHVDLLTRLDARVSLLRQPHDLVGPDGLRVDALVLPGGESSTIDRLLRMFGLFEPLREAIASGVPTLGTCAGLVLVADRVIDPAPGQQSLGVLDVSVRRNAFGSQVDSAEVDLDTAWGPAHVAFIRAPLVEHRGAGVDVIADYRGGVVGVRQGSVTGISFHPELTGETLFHRALLRQVRSADGH